VRAELPGEEPFDPGSAVVAPKKSQFVAKNTFTVSVVNAADPTRGGL
jgi:hypothetical protein